MKINWFSPVSPAQSGISEFSDYVLEEMATVADVAIWTQAENWDARVEKYGRVRTFHPDRMPWPLVHEADINFYNIGNNAPFHEGIWKVSRACPGVVILHDVRLHHFFEQIYREHAKDRNTYLRQLGSHYGIDGILDGVRLWENQNSIEYMSGTYPLTPLGLENALGAVVHTKGAFEAVKKLGIAACYLPLAYRVSNPPRTNFTRKAVYRIIIFGYIESNRRLEQIFEALAGFKDRNRFHLDICGRLWDKARIERALQKFGLNRTVKLHGRVSDSRLQQLLSEADLAINLRFPTMDEASISQLRIWSHSLASIVTRIGWYSQIPENAACFVDPESEIADLRAALAAFLEGPERFWEQGLAGYQLVTELHSPQSYVANLLKISEEILATRARLSATAMAEHVASVVQSWGLERLSDASLRRAAEAITFIAD